MRLLFPAILGKSVRGCERVCIELSDLKGLTVTMSGFVGEKVLIVTMQLCHCSGKTERQYLRGSVPIRLDLPTQATAC